MNSEDRYDWIEKYLSGALTEDSLKSFEQKMKDEPEFAGEVQLYREIKEALQESDIVDLSEKIKEVQRIKKISGKSSKTPFKILRNLLIAAGILLIAGSIFILNWVNRTSPNRLYMEFADVPDQMPVFHPATRELNPEDLPEEAAPALEKAIADYTNGDFEAALTALNQMDPETIGSDRFYYYRGLIHMKLERFEEAIDDFNRVTTQDMAEWYRALAHLKLDQIDKSFEILERISGKVHPRRSQATELIERLK